MHPVAKAELERHHDEIVALGRRFGVLRLWVFGSATGPEFDPARSDFDFLAEYGENPEEVKGWDRLVGLPREFSALLGRKVDVINWRMIRNPFFRRGAELSRQELYAA